jgi:hypothetical protein
VDQGNLWKHKPREEKYQGKNEDTPGTLHRRGLHRGAEKRRDPDDPGIGSKMSAGRDSMAPKVQNQVAKGRGSEYHFFHRTTIGRRTHNKILKIGDHDGIERESHQEIENTLVYHFKGIAQEPNQDRMEAIQRITQHIPRLVTEEQNINLNKPITKEEINQVVQEMPSGKAPSRDGFTVEFLKACWEVVKQDLYGVVEDSRCSASILKALNSTMITLIPKENEARTSDRYRPIALCNAVYKIISKVIANRLKPLLPTLISQE